MNTQKTTNTTKGGPYAGIEQLRQQADRELAEAYGVENPDIIGFIAFGVMVPTSPAATNDGFLPYSPQLQPTDAQHLARCAAADAGVELWEVAENTTDDNGEHHDTETEHEKTRRERELSRYRICSGCGKRVWLIDGGLVERHTEMPKASPSLLEMADNDIPENAPSVFADAVVCAMSGQNGQHLPAVPAAVICGMTQKNEKREIVLVSDEQAQIITFVVWECEA